MSELSARLPHPARYLWILVFLCCLIVAGCAKEEEGTMEKVGKSFA